MRKINFLFLLSIYATAVEGSEKWQAPGNVTATKTTTAVSVLDAAAASGTELLLERKRRYLIFEKGASVVFQCSVAKAIIPLVPRGINWITEYSLVYDLPYSIEVLKPTFLLARRTTKAPTNATTTARSPTMEPPHWQHSWQDSWQQQAWQKASIGQHSQTWQKKPFTIKSKVGSHRRKMLWCSRENAYKKFDNWNYAKVKRWCRRPPIKMVNRPPRRHNRGVKDQAEAHDGSELMFFDLVGKWAEMHDYNPRHCIMRALCESPHLLLPPGHSLLHDLLRILQDFALPHAAAVYAAAADAGLENLNECARLYGPHCRVSFLQHFTTAVHGKFM